MLVKIVCAALSFCAFIAFIYAALSFNWRISKSTFVFRNADGSAPSDGASILIHYEPEYPLPFLQFTYKRTGILQWYSFVPDPKEVTTVVSHISRFEVPERLAGFGDYRISWMRVQYRDYEYDLSPEEEGQSRLQFKQFLFGYAKPSGYFTVTQGKLRSSDTPGFEEFFINEHGVLEINPVTSPEFEGITQNAFNLKMESKGPLKKQWQSHSFFMLENAEAVEHFIGNDPKDQLHVEKLQFKEGESLVSLSYFTVKGEPHAFAWNKLSGNSSTGGTYSFWKRELYYYNGPPILWSRWYDKFGTKLDPRPRPAQKDVNKILADFDFLKANAQQ